MSSQLTHWHGLVCVVCPPPLPPSFTSPYSPPSSSRKPACLSSNIPGWSEAVSATVPSLGRSPRTDTLAQPRALYDEASPCAYPGFQILSLYFPFFHSTHHFLTHYMTDSRITFTPVYPANVTSTRAGSLSLSSTDAPQAPRTAHLVGV